MNIIASGSVSRSLAVALHAMGTRLLARTRSALRHFAALYAQGRMHQAALGIRRFEACHRPLSERDGGPRSRL
jgi:hypothetical protein